MILLVCVSSDANLNQQRFLFRNATELILVTRIVQVKDVKTNNKWILETSVGTAADVLL